MIAYAVVSLPSHFNEADLQVLFARLVSLLAVCVVGYVYQGIEQQRRARETADDEFPVRAESPLA